MNQKVILENEVERIVNLLKNNYLPDKIILFGSLIKGKVDDSSDIDLIIIKSTDEDPWKRQQNIEQFLDHNVPVDILVYTPEEIQKRLSLGDFFVQEFITEGKIIYERTT